MSRPGVAGTGAPPAWQGRTREVNGAPVRPDGEYVVYWMIGARRLEWNQGLERAVGWARALDRPLLVFEALRAGYRWASDRHHRFCVDGMREHARRLERSGVGYFPYLEPRPGEGKGLLRALSRRAAVVVTDDSPVFFLPRMVSAAGGQVEVRLEAVDSSGLLPLARPERTFKTAQSFRRYLQGALPDLLRERPDPAPLERVERAELRPFPEVPGDVEGRWPPATPDALEDPDGLIAEIPLDHSVGAAPLRGGSEAARGALRRFLEEGLPGYAEGRSHPDRRKESGLSPWLHWGHLSAWEAVEAVLDREEWTPERLAPGPTGKRDGWWGLSRDAEAFLDQLLTWREMGYVTAWRDPHHERWEALPEWARSTLTAHADDPRPHRYDRAAFEEARTHDELWNASQRELLERGVIHNQLRMLWGKKILEWSESPRVALSLMLELNNRWGIDGRDPNSASGIHWVLGRYDRGWPPRPVFGSVRSMSSRRTREKLEVKRYLERFGGRG